MYNKDTYINIWVTMLKDRTKLLFAETLKTLLEKKEFQDVRITDICKIIGCQRKTFYYHFEDKYQLAGWIYIHCMKELWDPEYGPYDFVNNYAKGLDLLREDLTFYRKVLADEALSGVYKHIVRYGDELFIKMITGKGQTIDDELSFMIHYSSLAQFSVVREWIFDNDPLPSLKLVEKIVNNFPEKLRNFLI